MQFNSSRAPFSFSLICSALLLSACGSSDNNNAPTLSGDLNPSVPENSTMVANYKAKDPDGDAITLTLSGEDSDLFVINQEGELSFKTAQDFETASKTTFSVTLTATENEADKLSTSLSITVSLGDVKDTPDFAAVQTIAPDYSSSEVVYIDALNQQVETGYYVKAKSDYSITSYNSELYHIGRFFIDTIDKYNVAEKDVAVWSYSTQDDQDSTSRNPYTLVSLNDTKAYLIRYGSGKIWVVNPQATVKDEFKIGELDISAYSNDNKNNTPSPSAAVILDDKLYIAMQRQNDNFSAGTAYVAVFDTSNDEEIETNANSDDNLKGIPLSGVNPLENSIITSNGKVYVTTRSDYSASSLELSRIEEISPTDFSVNSVLSAKDIENNTSGYISGTAIVSAEKGYFYSSETFFTPSYHVKSTLHEFNPTSGEIIASGIANTGETAINNIKLDSANFLWMSIGDPTAPGIDILNTETNEKYKDRLATELNPGSIAFVTEQ